MIPVWQPYIGEEEKKAIFDVLDIGYLGMGKNVFEFEECVALDIKAAPENVVATHTGQSSLHTILVAMQQMGKKIRKIITPSMNNVADFQAISAVNCEIIFCDCDPNTGLIDLDSIEYSIAKEADALVVLDYASNFVDLPNISDYCQENDLALIYDAAHSFGSVSKERLDYADATMFSFDPIKTFTAIDGGCIYSNNAELLHLCRQIRHMGMNQDASKLKENKRSFSYDVSNQGFRYHLSNVHAAVGKVQIQKKHHISSSRHYSLNYVRDNLIDFVSKNSWVPYDEKMIPFMNVMLLPNRDERNFLRNRLQDRGIQTGIHWTPGHHFSKYKKSPIAGSSLVNTDHFYDSILSIPLFTAMSDEQLNYICETIMETVKGSSSN